MHGSLQTFVESFPPSSVITHIRSQHILLHFPAIQTYWYTSHQLYTYTYTYSQMPYNRTACVAFQRYTGYLLYLVTYLFILCIKLTVQTKQTRTLPIQTERASASSLSSTDDDVPAKHNLLAPSKFTNFQLQMILQIFLTTKPFKCSIFHTVY